MLQFPCALQNWSVPLFQTPTSGVKFPPFPDNNRRYHFPSLSRVEFNKSQPTSDFDYSDQVIITRPKPRQYRWWRIALALNTGGGLPGNGEQNLNGGDGGGDSSGLGGTRLGRIVSAGGRQLLDKLNSTRKNFPMKVFLLLLGFYTANALATILGQTGDWDVLVAGVVVAAIEGIGVLMYGKIRPASLSKDERFRYFVGMLNFWKAGLCLGLFVDAFKLGS